VISRPRARRPVNLQILPSAMTVLSICAGLTSIKFALEHQPKAAMALIAAAAILDGLDGRVARILDAQSPMGAEIDSLADAVNFGVTPAIVLYVTLLSKSPAGWVVVLLYAVCVVLRLARYNTLQDDGTQPAYTHEFFVGMPAPAGAISMIGLVGLKLQFGDGWWTSPVFLCIWVTGTSILMVSKIPMKKMHAVSVPPNWAAPLLAVLAICAAAAVLAVLIGVNIGPNLTYAGSLATMLWRRVLHQHNHAASLGEFTVLGLLTAPAALVGAVVALWASLHLLGG